MSSTKVKVGELADAIMKMMEEVKEVSADAMKTTIKKTGRTIASEIKATAPRRSGKYASSWRSSVESEGAMSISVIVHSSNRYQIAHLLEHGHAKRNGGRVAAIPHIAPAEEKGIGQMEAEFERNLRSEL